MSRHRPLVGVAVALSICVASSSRAGESVPWIPFSSVMSELSQNPQFVDAVLLRLGRDPDDGGILGPALLKKLRELILGEHWEALDRFPALTVAGLGRSVRLAAAARQVFAEPEPVEPGTEQPAGATDRDVLEPLGIPADGAPLTPDAYLKTLGFGLVMGDRIAPERATRHADAARLAEVLNHLARNPGPSEIGPRYRIAFEGETADTPQELLTNLAGADHVVTVRDGRYFANFGDLIYKGRDVLTPFWIDTGISVPGTERSLLVPVGHSQHEFVVRGPVVNADLSFYFGIDGEVVFRPIDTRDQSWVLGRVARTYSGADALEVTRIAGAILKAYDAVKRANPDLPFNGYYALGVCNDVNAMIELHMQGETTLFPLTVDARYFQDDTEVSRLVRRLPVDRRGSRPEIRRVLGSLPVADPAELPLPSLRRDVELVQAAWAGGTLLDASQRKPLVIVVLVVSAALAALWIWRRRSTLRRP